MPDPPRDDFKETIEQAKEHGLRVKPGKGQVTIFSRSHYEDVLVARVHDRVPKRMRTGRYEQINDFEKMLADSGTKILKFYLHIDRDEQLEGFKQCIDDPARHWKISDYAERPFWEAYTAAFEHAFAKTSTDHSPRFAVTSNHKWFRNLAVSRRLSDLGFRRVSTRKLEHSRRSKPLNFA